MIYFLMSLISYSVEFSEYFPLKCLVIMFWFRPTIGYNVLRLGEGGDFTTNVDAKHKRLYSQKTVLRSTEPPLLQNRC